MGDKKPRYLDPKSTKKVKRNVNPESYKDSYISWQTNTMDFDFDFGWNNVIHRIRLEDLDDLQLELLNSGCEDEKLYESLSKCKYREFSCYEEFLDFLRKDNTKISIDDLKIVSKFIRTNYFWKHIFAKLRDLESVKWKELEKQTFGKNGKSKHHWVRTNKLIRSAQKRLVDLRLDDYQEIYSIRLTGANRLWGIRENSYFKILWFDPDHDICPSNKKHT